MQKALTGIRVIDIGQVMSAPVAGTFLGDFGAEVIKVEPPVTGDKLRHLGYTVNGVGMEWCTEGRNKKSVTLNLRHPRGIELLKRLVAMSDVLLENLSPGAMEKLGLTEEILLGINPRLIYGRISGFGKTGPMKHMTAYDTIALAFGGLFYVTGYPDRAPVRPGRGIVDYIAALFTAFGVLTAIYHRDSHNGKGQVIDVAMHEAVWRLMGSTISVYDKFGIVKERDGNRSPGSAIGGVFKTADEHYFTVMIAGQADLTRFYQAVGKTDWVETLDKKDAQGRPANLKEIEDHLRRWASRRTLKNVLSIFEQYELPCGPIYSTADIASDEQYRSRGMIPEIDVPDVGKVKTVGVVPRLTETPGSIEIPPPTLGQHNQEVYCGLLGLSQDELAGLKKEGVM